MNTENEKVVRDSDEQEIVDAYKHLHKGKIGMHWLWAAILRMNAGESEQSVMNDFGYVLDVDAALQSQVSNTDGWVMVPVEPTEEMLREGKYAFDDSAETSFRDIFQAMLSATPKAPQQESNTSQDGSSEATRHATALEQCAIFAADVGDNIAKAMTDAAAYLRTVSTPPQQQEQSGEAFDVALNVDLDAEAIDFLINTCMADESADDIEDRYSPITLWIGETVDDDGNREYGLNVALAEYPEEGSSQLVPLPRSTPTPTSDQAGAQEAVALDGSELWELLFGIFEGDVPEELTDDKITAIAEAINHAGLTSPTTPTATASQESAPEAGGEARPVAYRAWLDDERGARWVFTPWPEEEHLEVIWEPLFLALTPANAEAELEALIATRVNAAVEAFRLAAIHALNEKSEEFKQLANVPVMTDVHDRYIQISNTYSNAALLIEALPGSTKALEGVCMEVADRVAKSVENPDYSPAHHEAIVQSVIRKDK